MPVDLGCGDRLGRLRSLFFGGVGGGVGTFQSDTFHSVTRTPFILAAPHEELILRQTFQNVLMSYLTIFISYQ